MKIAPAPKPAVVAPQISVMTLKEAALASLVFLGLVVVHFHKPIFGTRIAQQTSIRVDPVRGLEASAEDVYSGYPPFFAAAEHIWKGKLPLWTPYTCGGTPLLGKQQSRVFSPFKPLFYLTPARYFQYLWLVAFVLHFYFAWLTTYMLARWYGLNVPASLFSAAFYTFNPLMTGSSIECTGEASIYTPAMFLLTEQFLHGNRRRALLFLPWVIAFPVLSGHLQMAFYAWVSVGVYAAVAVWFENESMAERVKKLLPFIAVAAFGAALASPPIVTGMEYIARSYTKVWRSSPDFWWFMSRISRQLTAEDMPCLTVGLLSGAGFIWCLIKLRLKDPFMPAHWPRALTGGALSLGISLACFMNIGLWDPWMQLPITPSTDSQPAFLLGGILLYFLSFLALLDPRVPRGLKVMGGLLLYARLLYLRPPFLVNLIYDLPIFKSLWLDHYHSSAEAALAIMSGYGLWRLSELAKRSWEERKSALWRVAQLTLLLSAGFILSAWLKDPVADKMGVGINPEFAKEGQSPPGGIMDAGKISIERPRHVIRGWIPHPERIQNVYVGLNGSPLEPAEVSRDSERLYFRKTVALKSGDNIPVAMAVDVQGQKMNWRGSAVTLLEIPSKKLWLGVAAFLVLLHLMILFPFKAGFAIASAFLYFYIFQLSGYTNSGIPDNLTQEWSGIKRLKQDTDIYRFFSFDSYLLPPELSGIHGISDIRNGGDNLDIATMIHFLHLNGALFNEREKEWGSQWLGLGNVKYVVARPNQPIAFKGLELIFSGEDMLVYLNRHFAPRLKFFDRWKYLDGAALSDWRASRNVLGALYQAVTQGQLDLERDLVLHSPPPNFPVGAPSPGRASKVEVISSDTDRISAVVDAQTNGFLFVSSNYFPGWKAYVDGRPASLLRSFITFCSIPVPQGRHVVHYIYHSARTNASLILSALAALFWMGWWRRWRGEPAAAPLPMLAPRQKSKKENAAPVFTWLAWDGTALFEKILASWIWINLLFWLNWCAWVYGGGIPSKVVGLRQWLFAGKTLEDLGYLGYPYAMGPFEGWTVNLIAAGAIAVLGCMALSSARKPKA